MVIKVSFDSNAWEKIFSENDCSWVSIRQALHRGTIEGLICEAAFRIEAVRKIQRSSYFARPMMDLQTPGTVKMIDGVPHILLFSFGPDDNKHLGLPQVQSEKIERALAHNCRIMHGLRWLGLPRPAILKDATLFAREPQDGMSAR